MPISRPFARAIRAVWFFIIVMYLLAFFSIYTWMQHKDGSLLYSIGFGLSLSIALFMSIRFFWNYKIIAAQKGKISVEKPYIFHKKVFNLSQIKEWEEQIIKTFNTEYRLITVRFENGFLEISNQEYDNYDKLKSYIAKNAASKKKI